MPHPGLTPSLTAAAAAHTALHWGGTCSPICVQQRRLPCQTGLCSPSPTAAECHLCPDTELSYSCKWPAAVELKAQQAVAATSATSTPCSHGGVCAPRVSTGVHAVVGATAPHAPG